MTNLKKRSCQSTYVAAVIVIGLILAVFITNNENVVGKVFTFGDIPLTPSYSLPSSKQTITAPQPCPAGSKVITQVDIDYVLRASTPRSYFISQPGDYCLEEDILVDSQELKLRESVAGVIQIISSDVTLDLNSHKITDTSGSLLVRTIPLGIGGNNFEGIMVHSFSTLNPQVIENVEIKNGIVEGFDIGIDIWGLQASSQLATNLDVVNVRVKDVTIKDVYDALSLYRAREILIDSNHFNNVFGKAVGVYGGNRGITITNNEFRGVNTAVSIAWSQTVNIISNQFSGSANPNVPNSIALLGYDTGNINFNENVVDGYYNIIRVWGGVTGRYENNLGCNIADTPVEIIPPANLVSRNNNWYSQNC